MQITVWEAPTVPSEQGCSSLHGMKVILSLALSVLLVSPALAAPPAHAPAHGYRNKVAKHRGYTGVEWEQDFGVTGGRCNTDAVLTVLGAATGAVIGNRTASAENRTLATIAGAVIGGVIGNEIGEALDQGDRGCMGHSLEVGRLGQAVSWTNPRTRVAHELTPVRDLPGGCRQFSYRAGKQAKPQTLRGCRNSEAAWVIRRD
jgi:surface antigen